MEYREGLASILHSCPNQDKIPEAVEDRRDSKLGGKEQGDKQANPKTADLEAQKADNIPAIPSLRHLHSLIVRRTKIILHIYPWSHQNNIKCPLV